MKVIDLLNKIANGKEVPKKVKVGYYYYKYEENGEYINVDDIEDLLFDFDSYFPLEQSLNQEIIEEDKKIEKLDIRNEKNCKNNWKWKVYGEEHSYNISTPQKIIADKINEIIDYLEENK